MDEDEEHVVEEAEVVSISGEVNAIEPTSVLVPVAQTAAVAATGFAIGAVTMAALSNRKSRKKTRRLSRKKKKKRGELLDIASSKSFLVDVHLLNR